MLTIRCPSCGNTYNVKDELVGKRFKCAGCGGTIVAQSAQANPARGPQSPSPAVAGPAFGPGASAGIGASAPGALFDDLPAMSMPAAAPYTSGGAPMHGQMAPQATTWGARTKPKSGLGAGPIALIVGGAVLGITVLIVSISWLIDLAGGGDKQVAGGAVQQEPYAGNGAQPDFSGRQQVAGGGGQPNAGGGGAVIVAGGDQGTAAAEAPLSPATKLTGDPEIAKKLVQVQKLERYSIRIPAGMMFRDIRTPLPGNMQSKVWFSAEPPPPAGSGAEFSVDYSDVRDPTPVMTESRYKELVNTSLRGLFTAYQQGCKGDYAGRVEFGGFEWAMLKLDLKRGDEVFKGEAFLTEIEGREWTIMYTAPAKAPEQSTKLMREIALSFRDEQAKSP